MAGKTVLIIDDDESLRRVMEYILTQAGYRCFTAPDGNEGLARFSRQEPQVVITDIQMPGLSGYEVLQRIRQINTETLVIVVTAFGSVERAVEAMKAGAFDYLTKPVSRDELCLVVNKAFNLLDLKKENTLLREQLADREPFRWLIGVSDRMKEVIGILKKVAATEATVLIEGESGTGKELVARAIHQGSDRSKGPFVAVNCAAIPKELLESELFGHRKGSFTGAVKDRMGKFEQAEGGTLFLDEVGELSLELQPKLLRALQEREVEPVGGAAFKVDVRVIAATNRDLLGRIGEGLFREDLYYRLAVIPVELPSLRERRDDIPLLVKHFIQKKDSGGEVGVSEEALEGLCHYDWPGNVRELENLVEQILILRKGPQIEYADLPPRIRRKSAATASVLNLPDEGYPLEDLEKEAVLEALRRNDWNQTRAAAFLRIPRHTLLYRMEKYQISKN